MSLEHTEWDKASNETWHGSSSIVPVTYRSMLEPVFARIGISMSLTLVPFRSFSLFLLYSQNITCPNKRTDLVPTADAKVGVTTDDLSYRKQRWMFRSNTSSYFEFGRNTWLSRSIIRNKPLTLYNFTEKWNIVKSQDNIQKWEFRSLLRYQTLFQALVVLPRGHRATQGQLMPLT